MEYELAASAYPNLEVCERARASARVGGLSRSGVLMATHHSSNPPMVQVHNLTITIPTPVEMQPTISASNGSASFSKRDASVTWVVPIVDAANTTGAPYRCQA